MITPRELDFALRSGVLQLGRYNRRTVRCALCAQPCLPTMARKAYLTTRAGRGVFLCRRCLQAARWRSMPKE